MRHGNIRRNALLSLLFAALMSIPLTKVSAVPSFSRQTGLDCASCHTVFPQLTSFGRDFKRHAYTLSSDTQGQTARLQEDSKAPVAAMLQSSYSSTDKAVAGSQNGTALFPDQLSLFYAGRISEDIGAFTQLTYEGADDHFTMDNADLRFARQAGGSLSSLVYGLTLNNNPGVADLWNSTPVWGFPYASSGTAPSPGAAPLIDGTLGQQVAGLGGYASWDNWIYAEATAYRSFQIGAEAPLTGDNEDVVKGVSPYWRLALSRERGASSLEIGTYGLSAKLYPGGGTPLRGPTNRFLDTGVDAQYQWLTAKHIVTLHSTWIHEKQNWDAAYPAEAASNPSDVLRTFRVDGTYYYRRLIGGSLGYFAENGDRDPLLYPADPVDGSRNGDPESRGFVMELAYVPWYNTKLSVHYTVYNRFNGGNANYDGFGRSASDNNTLYVNAWLMF
jgi:hypothetical protein